MGFGICSAPSIIKMTFSRHIRLVLCSAFVMCSISQIVRECHPFEIAGAVVCFNLVDMVHGFMMAWIFYKCLCHKSMHQDILGFAVLAEIHIQIPVAVVTESSNAFLYSAPSAI